MRIIKYLGYGLLLLLVIGGILAAFNWEKLVRLNAVNTLFSEEKIVTNFSSMRDVFFFTDIPSNGEVTDWQSAPKSLPETFQSGDQTRNIAEWLEATRTTSLLVVQDGKIAFEEYYLDTKPDDLRVSWSVAKSFLSAAFGTAVAEDKIDMEAPVDAYVPALKGSAYEGVKVINVLNMASGVTFNEDYLDFWSDINKMGRVLALGGSMDEFAAGLDERDREQGIVRQYVSIDTHILAMVLRAATGKLLSDYIGERIITPLGFEKQPYYLTDSDGNAFALGGLNITTRDYARFGQMYLDDGRWQGKQIVPAGWVSASTRASAPKPAGDDKFDYGYQWWVPEGSHENGNDYLARGIYGQFIYVNPANRTVIVRTAANRKFRSEEEYGQRPMYIHLEMFREISRAMWK